MVYKAYNSQNSHSVCICGSSINHVVKSYTWSGRNNHLVPPASIVWFIMCVVYVKKLFEPNWVYITIKYKKKLVDFDVFFFVVD